MSLVVKPGDLLTKPLRDVPFLKHYGIIVAYFYGQWLVLDIVKVGGDTALVRIVTLNDFCHDAQVAVEPGPASIDQRRLWTIARRLHAQGRVKYSLLNIGNGVNCESLARLIQCGEKESGQAATFVGGVMLVFLVGLLWVGAPVVATAFFAAPGARAAA